MNLLEITPSHSIVFEAPTSQTVFTSEGNESLNSSDAVAAATTASFVPGASTSLGGAGASSVATVHLRNVSDALVAFKVKTTAPRRYLVRPSNGTIPIGGEQSIKILLQTSAPAPQRGPDRFLFQATKVESTSVTLTKQFWDTHNALQEHKVSVTFNHPPPPQSGEVEGRGVGSDEKVLASDGIGASAPAPPVVATTSSSDSTSRGPAVSATRGAGDTERPPLLLASAAAAGPSLERSYNEVLQYCLAIEKQKANLSLELETVKAKLQEATECVNDGVCQLCRGSLKNQPKIRNSSGLEPWQIVAIVVGIVLILKMFRIL